jgi:hypothetical protein
MGYKHGDLHPGNILVNMDVEYVCNKTTRMPKGRVFLIDFGRTKKHGIDYATKYSRFTYNRSFDPPPRQPSIRMNKEGGKQDLLWQMFTVEQGNNQLHWLFKLMKNFFIGTRGFNLLWTSMERYTKYRLQIYSDYKSVKLIRTSGDAALKRIQSIKDELEKTKKSDENPMVIEEEDTYPDWEGLDSLSSDSSKARLSDLSISQLLYTVFPSNSLQELDISHPRTPELHPRTPELHSKSSEITDYGSLANFDPSNPDNKGWYNLDSPLGSIKSTVFSSDRNDPISVPSSNGSVDLAVFSSPNKGLSTDQAQDTNKRKRSTYHQPQGQIKSRKLDKDASPKLRSQSLRKSNKDALPLRSQSLRKSRKLDKDALQRPQSLRKSNKDALQRPRRVIKPKRGGGVQHPEFANKLQLPFDSRYSKSSSPSQAREMSSNMNDSKGKLDIEDGNLNEIIDDCNLNEIIDDGNLNEDKIILPEEEMKKLFQNINIFGGGIAEAKNEFFETKCKKIGKVKGGITKIKNKNNKSYHFSKKINYLRRKNNKTKKVFI